jgi:hypothetical protein
MERSLPFSALASRASLLLLGACAAASSGASARPAVQPSRSDDWRTAGWEDRHDTMTFAVLPTMARAFQDFNGTAYPDMTCRTCHGADAERIQYKMPNSLPPLDPQHLPDVKSADAKEARTARFMVEVVTPRMANLLGVTPFDPVTKTGLSCFSCHPSASK